MVHDPTSAATEYYQQAGIFPIMHIVGVRKSLADSHPWLPVAVLKAMVSAKDIAVAQLSDTSATKVTLPFVEEQLAKARDLMGEDFWSYGFSANRVALDAFLRHHHEQGLSDRLVAAEELFHPSTHEGFSV